MSIADDVKAEVDGVLGAKMHTVDDARLVLGACLKRLSRGYYILDNLPMQWLDKLQGWNLDDERAKLDETRGDIEAMLEVMPPSHDSLIDALRARVHLEAFLAFSQVELLQEHLDWHDNMTAGKLLGETLATTTKFAANLIGDAAAAAAAPILGNPMVLLTIGIMAYVVFFRR